MYIVCSNDVDKLVVECNTHRHDDNHGRMDISARSAVPFRHTVRGSLRQGDWTRHVDGAAVAVCRWHDRRLVQLRWAGWRERCIRPRHRNTSYRRSLGTSHLLPRGITLAVSSSPRWPIHSVCPVLFIYGPHHSVLLLVATSLCVSSPLTCGHITLCV